MDNVSIDYQDSISVLEQFHVLTKELEIRFHANDEVSGAVLSRWNSIIYESTYIRYSRESFKV